MREVQNRIAGWGPLLFRLREKASPGETQSVEASQRDGSVYKLQGRRRKPWAAAKSGQIIGCYETKTAALEALEKLSGRDITERYNMTFEEVFEAWKAEHYKTITQSGVASYNRAFDVFEPLHGQKFRTFRTADFQRVIDQHMEKKHSTVSKYKQLITQMSQWAMREEVITTDFAKYVRLPEVQKVEKEICTDDDIKKLEQDGSETARIVLMLLATGMRIGELFSLPVENYHETYVVGGEKTEAGRNRIIPIRPEGREYFAGHRPPAPVWLHRGQGGGQFSPEKLLPVIRQAGNSPKIPSCHPPIPTPPEP